MKSRRAVLLALPVALMWSVPSQAVRVGEPYCERNHPQYKYCEFEIRMDLIASKDYEFIEEGDGEIQFLWKVPLTDDDSLRDLKNRAERELVVLEQEAQRQVDQLVRREDQKLGNLINPSGNRLATSTEKREAAQRATVQLLARSYKTIEDDTIDRTIALLNETFKTMERDPLIAQTQKIEVTFTVLQNTFTIIKNITKQAMQGGCPELDDIKSTIEALKALYDQYRKWTRDLDKDVRELVELTEEFERLNHADSVQLDKGKKKADEMVKAAIDLEKKMARLRSGRIKNLIKETSQLTIQLRDLLDGLNENAVDTAGIRGLQTQIDNNLDHIEKFDKMMRVAADHLGTVSKAISPEFKFDRNWKEKVAEWWVGRQFDDHRRLRQLLVKDMNEVESLEAELIAITTTNMADAGQCSLLFDNM